MWVGVLAAIAAMGSSYGATTSIRSRPMGEMGPWSPRRSLPDFSRRPERQPDPEREARAAEKRERKRQKNLKERR